MPPRYPGEPHPGRPPVTDVLHSPQGLATALTVLLCVMGAISVFSAGVNFYTWSLMNDLVADPDQVPDSSLHSVDVLAALTALLWAPLFLGTATAFIIWFHRVRSNGGIFHPDMFTLGRGWAIGGWFVPIGNLFLPYRAARQTWEASIPLGPDGEYRDRSAAPLKAWWAVWVAAVIADRAVTLMFKKAEEAESLRGASSAGVVSDLLMAAAAVLAVLFVRKLTAMQNTRAAQGPYAGA